MIDPRCTEEKRPALLFLAFRAVGIQIAEPDRSKLEPCQRDVESRLFRM
jgi:hypothetical protein